MDRQILRYRNGIQIDGRDETINSVAITILLQDANENVLLASGNTDPTDGSSGYAKGTTSSSAFNPVTTPESDPAFLGDVTVGGGITDTLILNARIATGSVAGTFLDINDTYTDRPVLGRCFL
jgi:hypothetical protein